MRYLVARLSVSCGLFILLATTSVVEASPTSYGHGTYGSCTYTQCGITVSSNSTVNVNVIPSSSGQCTVQSDTVSVLTSNSSGFTLTMSTSTANTALVSGANSISASTATSATPVILSNNTWGYRVDGLGGFGAGPTTAQSNANSPLSSAFAGVPSSSVTAATLAATAIAANPAVATTIWYGVCADTTIPSGTYTTQVVYTAVSN